MSAWMYLAAVAAVALAVVVYVVMASPGKGKETNEPLGWSEDDDLDEESDHYG